MTKLIEANLYITYIAGALFLAAITGIIISVCVVGIIDKIKHRKFIEEKERLMIHLNRMIEWCSYEYPGVLDICQNLKDCLDGKAYYDTDHMRDTLRMKYGRENMAPFRSMAFLYLKKEKEGLTDIEKNQFDHCIQEVKIILEKWKDRP